MNTRQRKARRKHIKQDAADVRFLGTALGFKRRADLLPEAKSKHISKGEGKRSFREVREEDFQGGCKMPHKDGVVLHKGHYHPVFKGGTGPTLLRKHP